MPNWANPEDPFQAERNRIDAELKALLDPCGDGAVSEAMRYSVLGGGQRIRPILACRIASLAGGDFDLTLRAAAAVELLHCASLVVDDLPCMDNEEYRRGRPTVHIAFGEPTALLAAFGLVALAARCVVDIRCNPVELSSLIQFQINLLKVLDVCGLIQGQDMDLKLQGDQREVHRTQMNELKTVPLFELAAQAGLLFSEPSSPIALALRRFAREFGVSFQMVDDYLDDEHKHYSELLVQLETTRASLAPFQPAAGELAQLVNYLHARCLEKQGAANRRHR